MVLFSLIHSLWNHDGSYTYVTRRQTLHAGSTSIHYLLHFTKPTHHGCGLGNDTRGPRNRIPLV